ncbi:hypothetical protein BKA83DRAFT_4490421 [Pisolithus microcarpus]|nr:hypothetical protein BKA83DRAFT_4490421 [Pisolithus microcarpus]
MAHLGAKGIRHCDEQLVLLSYHQVTNGPMVASWHCYSTQGASKADQAAEQAQQQSEAAWQDQIRVCHCEDELVRKAEEAKRREQNIQAECNAFEQSRVKHSEKAQRETQWAQEEVRNAQQASKGVTKKARAAQAAAEKAAHEAAEYTHAAREVQEEAEKCLQRGIQLVVIPMLDEIATAKTRVQYEQGHFHFAVAGVLGSGKSLLINAICGVENRSQGAAEAILAPEGGGGLSFNDMGMEQWLGKDYAGDPAHSVQWPVK